MSSRTHYNKITESEIKELLDWYTVADKFVDNRPDCFSKNPSWTESDWPKETIKKILDRVLIMPYDVEATIFYHQKTVAFKLHVDSADGDQARLYKNILIPLDCDGAGTTVVFKNRWYGPTTRFSKTPNSPFTYTLPLVSDGSETVQDIRTIKDLSKYKLTAQQLNELIVRRSTVSGEARTDNNRNGDYNLIEGYNPELTFDSELHAQYLSHVDIENLHGLTVDSIYHWQPGEVFTFDRQQLHSAGSTHTEKKGITIFTSRKL